MFKRFLTVATLVCLIIFGYTDKPVIEDTTVTVMDESITSKVHVEIIDIKTLERPCKYTDDELALIARTVLAEAEGESELGKRLVIDVILNRIDSETFPNTVYNVIFSPGQFSCATNGRLNRMDVHDDILELVLEESKVRTNSEVLYFQTTSYASWGTPVLQEGSHYFSR